MALHPCTHCGRHVRHHEKSCPFCLGALSEMTGEQAPVLRVSRAAMWLGAALVAGGCEQPAPNTGSTNAPSTAAAPAAPSAPQVLPTTVSNGQAVAPQQGLFPQAQIAPTQESPAQQMLAQPTQPAANPTPTTIRPQDFGSVAARYGRAPAPPPQGPDDPGSHARRYGAPALIEWDEV